MGVLKKRFLSPHTEGRINLAAYAFILVMMARVAYGIWQDSEDEIEAAVKNDKRILYSAAVIYAFALGAILIIGLR